MQESLTATLPDDWERLVDAAVDAETECFECWLAALGLGVHGETECFECWLAAIRAAALAPAS